VRRRPEPARPPCAACCCRRLWLCRRRWLHLWPARQPARLLALASPRPCHTHTHHPPLPCRLAYPLALLTPVAASVMDFARSQLEWMHSSVAEAFENRRENMFATRYLRTCQSRDELAHLPQVWARRAGAAAGSRLRALGGGPGR
jgi:hypothetical protein